MRRATKGMWVAWLAAMALAVAACRPDSAPSPPVPRGDNTRPAGAVLLLTRHLLADDLVAFARDSVPPGLHRRLSVAWREGRTRWPLEELPFDDRLPAVIAALSASDAETRMQQAFDRQFSGAHAEIRAAAEALGLFGVQYVQQDDEYSDVEREHYAQFIAALGIWGTTAPLGDPARARAAIPELARAARATRLASDADFTAAGMDESLRRMGAFIATAKQVLGRYDLPLDDSLRGMRASLHTQTGDSARVRMQYVVGGQPIDAFVDLQRHKGRWYLAAYLRRAEAAATSGTAVPTAPAAPG